MAPYSLCLWLCLLIAVVIPPHLTTQQQVADSAGKYVPQKAGPWRFMSSNPKYVRLSTLDDPDLKCIKANITNWNSPARTLSQRVVKLYSRSRAIINVNYDAMPKNGRVRTLTSVEI
ncbi:hypothetical protein MTO96_041836, partial [Rhipicephalus appendiculatus]